MQFSGFSWRVKHHPVRPCGPGANFWHRDHVQVVDKGLRLRVGPRRRVWHCAEAETDQRLGFGLYQFKVNTPLNGFDPQLVLGLFTYPTPDVGQDGSNEIDIEIAQFPHLPNSRMVFGVFPATSARPRRERAFPQAPSPRRTLHQFHWQPHQVTFRSYRGHRPRSDQLFAEWTYAPPLGSGAVPHRPMPLHLNLWLRDNQPPADGRAREVEIGEFSFSPRP